MSSPKRKPKTGRDWEFLVSRAFLDREDISGQAKWIAVCLRGWCDKSGYAHPTMAQIAKRAGVSLDTAEKYLDELKSREVIEWSISRDKHGHRRRRYFMGQKMAKAMGVALPYGHGGKVTPLTVPSKTGEAVETNGAETLYDYDLNFMPRREPRSTRM